MTHLLAKTVSQQTPSGCWDEIKNLLWNAVKQTIKEIHTALIAINKLMWADKLKKKKINGSQIISNKSRMHVGPVGFLPTSCPEECEAHNKSGHNTINRLAQQISVTINLASTWNLWIWMMLGSWSSSGWTQSLNIKNVSQWKQIQMGYDISAMFDHLWRCTLYDLTVWHLLIKFLSWEIILIASEFLFFVLVVVVGTLKLHILT